MQENLANLARGVFSLNLHAVKSGVISGTTGPTKVVHLSEFAEFSKKSDGIVPFVVTF